MNNSNNVYKINGNNTDTNTVNMNKTNAMNKATYGKIGEGIAVKYLINNDFVILKENYRFSRLGEIDIIACENEYICFIEVKTRTNNLFGAPSESVNKKKQNRIRKIAQIYLNENNLYNMAQRYDVLEIIMDYNTNKVKDINLIRNAF